MSAWTSVEFARIGAADLLHIAVRRADGSLRNLVPIWVVAHGGRLYIRSVNGREAAWFRGAQSTHDGHIRAGGVERDVTFVDVAHDIDDALDAAYRTKYGYSPSSVARIVSPRARSATLELVPR